MGLRAIAEDLKMGTEADYQRRKAECLKRVDPRKEYASGGHIYCAFCRKEISLDMPERNFYVKGVCECVEQRERAEKQREERLRLAKASREENEAQVPVEAQRASFYNLIAKEEHSEGYIELCARCEKFCRNFGQVKGTGIWLYGDMDTGKTYLAAAMLHALQEEGRICVFTTAERIFEELKATYKAEVQKSEASVLGKYASAECLFLDDFQGIKVKRGAESWAADKFSEIMGRRYARKLPTVVTSRVSLKDLAVKGLIPASALDKLVGRTVGLKLEGIRRKPVQEMLVF